MGRYVERTEKKLVGTLIMIEAWGIVRRDYGEYVFDQERMLMCYYLKEKACIFRNEVT